jgi:hypothetical protein
MPVKTRFGGFFILYLRSYIRHMRSYIRPILGYANIRAKSLIVEKNPFEIKDLWGPGANPLIYKVKIICTR